MNGGSSLSRSYPLVWFRRRQARSPHWVQERSWHRQPPWYGYYAPTMALQKFERRLERFVEGAFARVFRSGLQPVEISRRLTREMDLRRTVAPRGVLTP